MSTIQELNDRFRASSVGGKVFLTQGVASLPAKVRVQLFEKVRTFDKFDEDNDPYGEHGSGSIRQNGLAYFWKIDYYNADMTQGSEDPGNEKATTRLLTIMQVNEY